MSTQNYPHINDDVLKALDDCDLIYLDETDSDCNSLVVRLAPAVVKGEALPMRFEKMAKINRYGQLDTQVTNEGDIFNRMREANITIDRIVNRISYFEKSNNNYVLTTESVGLDADKWQGIPLYLNGKKYEHIFCHPLVFLNFIKGTLLALQSIHQHGLYHCDIKMDQICIPFIKNGNNITINPNSIKLIDFGISIYKMHHVTTRNPVRFTSNNMKRGDYVSETLINAGDYQSHLYQTTGEYDFSKLLNQIDCAVDLYSFGFLLNSFKIKKRSVDVKLWNSFENEYQVWVKELLALSNKKTPFKDNLPHDKYLHQVNEWIQNVQEESGLTIDKLVFEIENTNPIPYQPTNTPTPPREDKDIDINIDNTSSYKEFNEYDNINIKNDNAESNLNAINSVQQSKTIKSNRLFRSIIILVIIATVLITADYIFFNNNYPSISIPKPNSAPDSVPESVSESIKEKDKALFPIRRNGKYGYIDKTGRMVIDFEFDYTDNFSDGLASVQKDGKYGYIDKTGRMVIDFEFDYADNFSDGLACIKKDGKYGYIDKTGQMVTGFEFDNAWGFNESLARVEKDDKYGYIDKTGRMVTGFEFDNAWGFNESLALVEKDDKYGYIDKTGRMVIDFEFDYADNFSDGLASVQKDGKYGYIDKTGRMVIDFEFDYADNFSDGLAQVLKYGMGGYGYIDKIGKMIFVSNYTSKEFHEDLAIVVQSKDGGLLDATGDNHQYGFIDKTGQVVIDFEFDYADNFSDGLASVQKDGKYGYIDKTGQMVTGFEFDNAWGFNEGLARVEKDGVWHYIDQTGKIIASESDF